MRYHGRSRNADRGRPLRPQGKPMPESAEAASAFDRDTGVTRLDDRHWRAEVHARWDIQDVPNGGYLMALAARALGEVLPHPDPLTVTGHYVQRAFAGPVTLQVEVVRQGRSVSTGEVRLRQDDIERARFLASFGDLSAARGPTREHGQPPPMPAPEACEAARMPVRFMQQFDLRLAPTCAGWLVGEPGEAMALEGWTRFADGRDADPLALLMFADGFPPAVFNRYGPSGWVPTLELTVHVRARPAPGYLRGSFATRHLIEGLMEEDGELWDAEGNLVALARQMARFRLPEQSGEATE